MNVTSTGTKIAAIAAALMVTAGGAAHAGGPPQSEDDVSNQAVPNCVEAWDDSSGDVYVENHCATSKRYKVVMAFAPDLSCQTIKSGWRHTYDDPTGRFDGLKSC